MCTHTRKDVHKRKHMFTLWKIVSSYTRTNRDNERGRMKTHRGRHRYRQIERQIIRWKDRQAATNEDRSTFQDDGEKLYEKLEAL